MSLGAGDKLTLTVEDIAFGGEGVARLEDFVVFVPFVAEGEVVEAEITHVGRRFARARLLRILAASPERITPPCKYFGMCGGCQYQHLAYTAQLRVKQKQIGDLFERIGRFDRDVVAPIVPCPQPYGYRNRIMIRTQWDKCKQGLNVGFIRADSRLVVDVEECKLAELPLNEQIKHVRAHPPPRGGLKVVLRIPPEGWEVPPDSFFQNNFFLLPSLVEVVRQRLRESRAQYLLDVYCGVGFFSIELGDLVQSYVGVELDRLAIQAARRNALAHGRTNGEFVASPAEDVLPTLISRFPVQGTTVLLDPPRRGCQPDVLQVLRHARPCQVIYISCHPATMARDLNILCGGGVFELVQVIPLDLFPQTQHVECVADLRCQPAGGPVLRSSTAEGGSKLGLPTV